MTQDELKQKAALAALDYLPENGILGIGSGSTVKFFIEASDDDQKVQDKLEEKSVFLIPR